MQVLRGPRRRTDRHASRNTSHPPAVAAGKCGKDLPGTFVQPATQDLMFDIFCVLFVDSAGTRYTKVAQHLSTRLVLWTVRVGWKPAEKVRALVDSITLYVP